MNNHTTTSSNTLYYTPLDASERPTLQQRLWQYLCIGARYAPDAMESRKVIQTNAAVLIYLASMVFYNITFMLNGNAALILSSWVQTPLVLLSSGTVLLLNQRGQLLLARWALLLGAMVDVTSVILIGGGTLIFTHGYFLIFASCIPLYFSPNQWRSVMPLLLVNIGLFFFFHTQPIPTHPAMQELTPAIITMLQTCVLCCGALLGIFSILVNEYCCARNQTLLQRMANSDSLTKLPNRRAFRDHLQRELARSARDISPLVIAMIDVDYFKHVNDEHGHDVGDNVLQGIAKLISQQSRATDIVARMGGEEFAVLMPDTPLDNAQTLAERMRMAVAAFDFGPADNPFKAHISIGLASVGIHMGENDALKAADTALYRAKNEGRNRVVTHF